jgi:hypothetical protein
LAEWRAEAVTGIRQYTAEADTGCDHAIDLSERDLWLRPGCSIFDRDARSRQPPPSAGPTLGKKKAQAHHHRHFTTGKRQRYQRLAVGGLAEGRSILRSHTNRMLALLRQRSVVDHQHRIGAADEPVGLDQQFGFQRCRFPNAGSNKMVQLIIIARRKTFCHRLNALAITGPDQPCHVKRTHPLPGLVAQVVQERLEPTSKLILPAQSCFRHGRPSKRRPPMNH